jgi:hypothetical protein
MSNGIILLVADNSSTAWAPTALFESQSISFNSRRRFASRDFIG